MKNLLLIFAIFIVSCGGDKGSTSGGETTCPAGKSATTASGICIPNSWMGGQINRTDGGWIFLEKSVPEQHKERIGQSVVKGLEKTVRGAGSWAEYRNTAQFQVVMIEKHATNQDGTPALIVGGQQTAGTVINTYPVCTTKRGEPTIVLPIPDTFDDAYFSYLENSAWFEGEHATEWKNDPCWTFQQYTGANDVHPHRPVE